jgi:hypothetical protein
MYALTCRSCHCNEVLGRLTFSRGASGSAGHTSWSAKPELGDYVSFYGFMIHYLNGLVSGEHYHSYNKEQQLYKVPSGIEVEESHSTTHPPTRLLLAGYSYGSMIASHLPSVEVVLQLFKDAAKGSAETEIQLRAHHLSFQTLKENETRQERNHGRESLRKPASHSNLGSSQSSASILVGGFESEDVEKRIDRESRSSLDVRRSLDRVRDKVRTRSHRSPDDRNELEDDMPPNSKDDLIVPQIYYLLISPVLPPVARFATFFSTLSFKGEEAWKRSSSDNAGDGLVRNPSLAVYGSKDFFTSVKKLRTWAHEHSQEAGSTFQYHEVEGAGHFWHEAGALDQMKKHIREWESSL